MSKYQEFEKVLKVLRDISSLLKDKNEVTRLYDWIVREFDYEEAPSVVFELRDLREFVENEMKTIQEETKRKTEEEMIKTIRYVSDFLRDTKNIMALYDWVVTGSVYDDAPSEVLDVVLGLDYLEEELMWL